MQPETVLINYVFWPAFGHALEALRFAHGYHAANPDKRISLMLNSHTPLSVAEQCPWIDRIISVDISHDEAPFSAELYAGIPTAWDYIVSDPRGDSTDKYSTPGAFGKHFAYVREHFTATAGRGTLGDETLPYQPNTDLRIQLPEHATSQAADTLQDASPKIAVLLAGGSYPRAFWPSLASWEAILDRLKDEHGNPSFYFIGKSAKSGIPTPTQMEPEEVDALINRFPDSVNCYDVDLLAQLAIIKECDLFVSPHSGFGFATSLVNTPWLTISGGRWAEYFFNGTPFHSVLPDPRKYPCYDDAFNEPVEDEDGSLRIPSMKRQRILDDLDEIAAASQSLIRHERTYEETLRNHFEKMRGFYSGKDRIHSFDNIHEQYL